MEEISLLEEEVLEILLHRDIHFGSQWSIMEDYRGKGATFEPEEVAKVRQMEEAAGENLAPLLFSEGDMKLVAKVRSLYQGLRDLCEQEEVKQPYPKLIAELILAEEDEEVEALEGVMREGKAIVPELLKLATHPEFAGPLYPGYGKAPLLAIYALARMGDRRAIVPLFELVGHESLEVEGAAVAALGQFRDDAEPFLLNILEGDTITPDTERAAIVLTTFPYSKEIQQACQKMLRREGVPPTLKQYLEIGSGQD